MGTVACSELKGKRVVRPTECMVVGTECKSMWAQWLVQILNVKRVVARRVSPSIQKHVAGAHLSLVSLCKATWFDREKAVNAKKRQLALSYEKLREQLSEMCSNGTTLLAKIDDQKTLQAEKRVLNTRVEALQHVLREGPEAPKLIKDFIDSFKVELGSTDESPAKSPPCRLFAELFPVKDLQSLVAECDKCFEKAELDILGKKMNERRKPLIDLQQSAKASAKDLEKAA